MELVTGRRAPGGPQLPDITKELSMLAFPRSCSAPRGRRFRPEVQALEDRQLLSVSSTFFNGVLTLTGNKANDFVSLAHDGNGLVTGSATGIAAINQSGVNRLVIETKGGRDTVFVTQTGNLLRSFDLDVRLGDDPDVFSTTLQGSIAGFRTMNITVNGDQNSDRMTVAADQNVGISTGAKLQVRMEGGGVFFTDDKLSFFYRGLVKGTLEVAMDGGRGDDVLTALIGLAAGSTGQVGTGGGARLDGGGGDDRLTFEVSDFSGATVNAAMDGGGGKDTGTHTTNVRASGLERNNVVNFQ
jgi:hypothetical protein